jgi:thiol:disulfide interchange protein
MTAPKNIPMSARKIEIIRRSLRTLSLNVAIFALVIAALHPALAQAIYPMVNKHLYSETANPSADIAAAIKQARREHKRIILDFGGNWCGDCQLLDIYYHQSPNAKIIAQHFIIVHVDIGHMDHNVATAQRYNVPITKGVPALAVLDSDGKLLYAERDKEFEHTSPEAITAFLNRWKPGSR